MQTHDVGEPATIRTDWYGSNGQGAEPVTIDLVITKPDGVTITKTKADMTGAASVGVAPLDVWRYTTPVDLEGLWRYDATGEVGGATVKLPSGLFLVSSEIGDGPCEPWTSWDEVETCGTTLASASPQQRELAIDEASGLLYLLSGAVYSGICQRTRSLCYACRTCYLQVCGCAPLNGLDLRGDSGPPVWGVWDVTIDGVVLAPSATQVVNRRWVVRTDGGAWPSGLDVSDPQAFRATIAAGRRIPAAGRRAARLFAAEIAKGCVNDASCQIPKRVTNITRGGVTYTILDSMKMIEEGRTGVPLVDLWLVADKKGRRPRPRIFVPGSGSGVRTFR